MELQDRQPLIDVVVKIAGDACPFFILRVEQTLVDRRKRLFGLPAFREVDDTAHVPGERTVTLVPRGSGRDHRPVLTVVTTNPILHLKAFPPIERPRVSIPASPDVVRVHRARPSSPESGFERLTGHIEP